jgi:hypothetical protein
MIKNIITVITLFILFSSQRINAQNFNYSFSPGNSAYQPLSNAHVLINTGNWDRREYNIPIGFSFNFLGQVFDTVTVTGNGFLLFGKDNKRAIAAFKGIAPVTDSLGNTSSISYTSNAEALKIQYKGCGFGMYPFGQFNFQVCLYPQSNKVEFRTGPGTLSSMPDSLAMPVAGFLNPSMDSSTKGYLLTGDPSQPVAESVEETKLKYLIRIPGDGQVYTFTPLY